MPDTDTLKRKVGVNLPRLLKTIVRYPGQFDVLRELIQNADDAEADTVEIHFETGEVNKSGKVDVTTVKVRKWIIKNNGNAFKEKDWEKLGIIADGNNDSNKIGAFGVGFYSVLRKSDRPLVRSNGKFLEFSRDQDGESCIWSGDCPPDPWTSVELELQNPEPLPVLADLSRFLISSIAFLKVCTISIDLDGQRLLHIQKESGESLVEIPIPIPPHLKCTTPLQTLTVQSIRRTVQSISVDAIEWAFTSSSMTSSSSVYSADTLVERSERSGKDNPKGILLSPKAVPQGNTIMYDLYEATTHVNLHPESVMKKGVESSSMKSLPSSFESKVVYFNFEQYDPLAGISNSQFHKAKHPANLFFGSQAIFPGNDSGRLFIGQSTNQTTGIGLHLSAYFLPTMERGSIDLADGSITDWNNEVLWTGGLIARIIYEEEMRAAKSRNGLSTQLGLCTMARFAFGPTSPDSRVSQILQEAFFSCCSKKSPFPVVSDVGISCTSDPQFRQDNNELSFLKKYRRLNEEVKEPQRKEIIKRYNFPSFNYNDILLEFETGVTKDAMRSFFAWWEDHRKRLLTPEAKAVGEKFSNEFASRSVLSSSNRPDIARKNKHFTFFPLPSALSPPHNMYFDISSGVPTRDTLECFGWTQLSLLDWLKHACDPALRHSLNDQDMTDILRILVQFALVEDLAPRASRITDLMKDIKCIPTNKGLKSAAESYFDEADICGSLPVVKSKDILSTCVVDAGGFRNKEVSLDHIRNVLVILGVHRKMEWEDMIKRLETEASEDSNDRLLRFLAVNRETLTNQEFDDLKKKAVFYSEEHGPVSATELHFPNEDVRRLKLPILALPYNGITSLQSTLDPSGLYAVESFMELLGIQRYPSLDKVIAQAASSKPEVQKSALRYLLSNLGTLYDTSKLDDFANVAYIPTESGSLARPNEVLASPGWEEFGFKRVSKSFGSDLWRLGVKNDPSIDMIIEYFKTPERSLPDFDTAAIRFGHLHRDGKFSIPQLREQLSTKPFVPVECSGPSSSELPTIKYISPGECFIASSDTKEHYRNIFPFAKFGQDGNGFLESCGAKKSLDVSDILGKMVQDPEKYLKDLGSDTNLYLEDLRAIASRFDSISKDDKKAMKKAMWEAPMFLAFRKQAVDGPSKLLPAYHVAISDWERNDFGANVFLAPEGEVIKKMYHEMGSEFLGAYVQYDFEISGPYDKQTPPFNRDQVIQRIRCFMRRRDGDKTDVSFYHEDSTDNFRIRTCKSVTMKKTLQAPPEVLADGVGATFMVTKPEAKAGFTTSKPYTLWVVNGHSLHNDIAVALCRALLKTFGPDEVVLLTGLIAMDDKDFSAHYDGEMNSGLPSTPAPKVKPKKDIRIELRVPSSLARLGEMLIPNHINFPGQKTMSPEEDMEKALVSWGKLDPNGQPPDFSAPCRPTPRSLKKYASHCKQGYISMPEEKTSLLDESTQIRFFLAKDAGHQLPTRHVIQKFAQLISDLTLVFGQEPSMACYIFWKDTDENLMAFNWDQKYLFFNLAHYHKFFYAKRVEEKKAIMEWYLIMAHEIAHNVTMDHDEYHGSLSSRLAVTYLPQLHKKLPQSI